MFLAIGMYHNEIHQDLIMIGAREVKPYAI